MPKYTHESFVPPASTFAHCATADKENTEEMEVVFCCFSARDMAIYQELIGHLDAERAYGAQG